MSKRILMALALYEAILESGIKPPTFHDVTEAVEEVARAEYGAEWAEGLARVGLGTTGFIRRMLPPWIR